MFVKDTVPIQKFFRWNNKGKERECRKLFLKMKLYFMPFVHKGDSLVLPDQLYFYKVLIRLFTIIAYLIRFIYS